MRNTQSPSIFICFMLTAIAFSQIFGCASIQHPTGGPRDSVAPTILNESPKNFTTHFKGEGVSIEFDEYFKLSNEFKEISISPAMEKLPSFKTKKKFLNIEFQEPLQDSTTYTINFGKAIVDYNEGNVLKNYVYVFSTGSKIDSLSISGTVLNTLTKQPVLDATVFLLPLSQDTLFGKKRASLFTSTDSAGRFSIKYLKGNTYNIYALKEESGDKIYNSTNELIGFNNTPIILTKDTSGIRLEIFKENPLNFRVIDRRIEKTGRIAFAFNRGLEDPSLQILQPAALDSTKIVEFSTGNDSAFVWTQSLDFDSINVAFADTGRALDTLIIRRNKRDVYNQELGISDNISSGRLKPGTDLILTLSAPVGAIDGKKFSLLQDSVAVTGLRVARDSLSKRKIILKYPWREERTYILTIGEGGFTGIFGGTNKDYSKQFSKDIPENYGELSLIFTVPDTTKQYLVQLLNQKDDVIDQRTIGENKTLNFPILPVGKYYLRIIYDANKNEKWDTGNVAIKRQPENVWNFEEELSLKANWELEKEIKIPSLE